MLSGPVRADWHTDEVTKNVPTTPPAVTSTSLRRPPVLQSLVVLTFAVLLVLAFVLDRGVVVIGVLALLGTASGFDPTSSESPPWSHGLPGVPDGPSAPSPIPVYVYG